MTSIRIQLVPDGYGARMRITHQPRQRGSKHGHPFYGLREPRGERDSGVLDEIAAASAGLADALDRIESLVVAAHPEFSMREIAEAAGFPTHRRVQEIIGRSRTDRDAVVYYVQRCRDEAIKIGTSVRLEQRLHEIARDHGSLDLLGVERGGRLVEAARHGTFADVRLGATEWFAPTASLLNHIASL